jgi:hypothetical protein
VFFHKTAKLKPTNIFFCGFRLLVNNLNHSTTEEALNNNNISEANKILYNLLFSVFIIVFWLENNITENQWEIAEIIYTPFQNGSFLTCTEFESVHQFLENKFQKKIAEIS